MNFMVFDGFGGWVYGYLWRPLVYIICLGLSQAIHVHVVGRHVHCINHSRIVMGWAWLYWLLAFTRV